MSILQLLTERSQGGCELCGATTELDSHPVDNSDVDNVDRCILACSTCRSQIAETTSIQPNHWRCLNESVWSSVAAVQAVSWRMLNQLSGETWTRDLLDQVYLEEDVRSWAEAGLATVADDDVADTVDSNGTVLQKGDTVTLIKDLVVKGGGFTAKRGTTVKNIVLTSNPKHVEGRINGTQIVLVSAFLKKTG